MSAVQHGNEIPDFQARRFRQQPQPNSVPLRSDQRTRYTDRFQASDYQWHPGSQPDNSRRPPTFPTPRRPQHRISARISARPKRSPSPTSSDSSTSPAVPSRPRSRSRSVRSRVSSSERISHRDHVSFSEARVRRSPPSGRRSPDRRNRPITLSPTQTALGRPFLVQPPPKAPLPVASGALGNRRPSAASPHSSFPFDSHKTVSPPHQRPREARVESGKPPSAPSSNSIRSTSHSSPNLAATEFFPDEHAHTSVAQPSAHAEGKSSAPASVYQRLPVLDDNAFQMPGVRLQKDGALKPGFSPLAINSGLDANVGQAVPGQL